MDRQIDRINRIETTVFIKGINLKFKREMNQEIFSLWNPKDNSVNKRNEEKKKRKNKRNEEEM